MKKNITHTETHDI
ncbi:hypothetical protein F383_19754 [Gossypium arboreum]|uniref:Uncharacterized protein n=1 Tax=Gossypium arboreum TaxID=29729 RepID=A0A0B0MBI3_GOSAR|nr:hypothetical protein F383_19754 [Gossypium arboreum]